MRFFNRFSLFYPLIGFHAIIVDNSTHEVFSSENPSLVSNIKCLLEEISIIQYSIYVVLLVDYIWKELTRFLLRD